jgi:hypothetical protein
MNIKMNKEIIKTLRDQTGISISLCIEAVKESNGELDSAMEILKQKCYIVGKKFYKNPERPLSQFYNFFVEEEHKFINIKFGMESEFLINSDLLHDLVKYLTSQENFMNFIEKNNSVIEEKLLYICGVLRENVQLLAYNYIQKTNEEVFLIQKKNLTNNDKVVGGLNIIVLSGPILDIEAKNNFLINVNAIVHKQINNILNEKNPHILFMKTMEMFDIHEFIDKVSIVNREIKIKDILNDIVVKKIISF